MVKNGTLKLTVSQESTDGINLFFWHAGTNLQKLIGEHD